MNKPFTLTYSIAQLPLEVRFADRLASIDFTPYTQSANLHSLYQESAMLVLKIKTDYTRHYQKQLRISNASFIAEIWGHLIVYRVALWMKKNSSLRPIQRLARFVAFRSGVADCGEGKVDTNRWIWDLLGWAFF